MDDHGRLQTTDSLAGVPPALTARATYQEQIATVLNCFHDGRVVRWRLSQEGVVWQIEIPYLSTSVGESGDFTLTLLGAKDWEFAPWNADGLGPAIDDTDFISKLELGILSAEWEDERLSIAVETNSDLVDCSGGQLSLSLTGVSVNGPDGSVLSAEVLLALSQTYWASTPHGPQTSR